ncbi:MAG: recombinase family protein [Candidatus Sungbacteria bacterium]|nr:recombinase family protein [Candidatus Sungbacteria bacterium]
MSKEIGKIKYFAYVRKSTEGEERQALSIPAQKDKLNEIFGKLDIEFVEDKASAFKPFNRPAFADMFERIHKGERTGLIAWHPDRLSRNEKDAGEITYMIRTGVIQDLKLATYHFENTPEGIWMLQMALSQSQYESAKKGRDVKRGLEQKARMGIYPTLAPLGYINDKHADKGYKTIHTDPDRFDIVRKIFDLMLTGTCSPMKILKIANEEWKLTMPDGKQLGRSTLYALLTRPFYYGEFEYPVGSGNWHKGVHKQMITREEYDRIQFLLGRPSQVRAQKRNIAYRGPIRCGECGCMITAEIKTKYQKNGNVHRYTYYHCTKRRDPNCTQQAVEESELEKQIAAELTKLEIPTDFKDWAVARLRQMNTQEVSDREKIYGNQRREYEACVRRIDNLIDMRANGEITEDEFKIKKTALLSEKERFQELLKDTDKRVENWLEIAERGFNFAEKAATIFAEAKKNDNIETKREIFAALGSDLILKDRKLNVSLDNLLFPIQTSAKEARKIAARLEPAKNRKNKIEIGHLYARSPVMLVCIIPLERFLWNIRADLPSHSGSHSLLARMTRQKS